MQYDDLGVEPRFLIRDADTKFSGKFLEVWKLEDIRVIQIPHISPRANAFAESFIGTIKRECLNFFLCFSLSQLDYICRSWLRHYHVSRPHQGNSIGNNVLDVNFKSVRDGPIKCQEDLGGIIKPYYREAA
jgi:putative transposase